MSFHAALRGVLPGVSGARSAAAAGVTLALLALFFPTVGSAAVVAVDLSPTGRIDVPQGLPFKFSATVHNDTDSAQLAIVVFDVASAGQEHSSTPFFRWAGSVPPQSQKELQASVIPSQWYEQEGSFVILAKTDGVVVGDPLEFTVVAAPTRVPKFQDMSSTAGIVDDMPDYDCGRWPAGAAWGDADGDADLDIYVPRQDDPSRLWINDGSGHFSDEAVARGVADPTVGLGAVFADYDNDGDQDLYVASDGPNSLFANDGTGHFTDVAATAGVAGAGESSSSASWGDYDNDGYLDLYVTNYGHCQGGTAKETLVYDADKLYHNEGDGTFTDQTALVEKDPTIATDGATTGAGFQAAWFDYDWDGDLDLYLANDFLGPRPDKNHLWRNDGLGADGKWSFTDVSVASETALQMNTMGIGVGDYDNDTDLDFGLSNIEDNRLMKNDSGVFTDAAGFARVARPIQRVELKSITWGMVFADLNLDGWEDIYTGAGSLKGTPDPQANELFVNGKNGRFLDLSAPSQADDSGVTRGVALADFDRDGRLDIYIINQEKSPVLLRNVTSKKGRHWLEIDTIGTDSNRDGCGARLVLTAGTKT
ncbi:MAG: FG-GAP repeat domain-containing protein, partial [Acidimicrobiia bacterium]